MPPRGGAVGSRRLRVTLQTQVHVADGAGGSTSTWELLDVVWASILSVDGSEQWARRALVPTATHVLNIRYRSGITPAMRVLIGTRVFNILAVVDATESRHDLTLYCTEEVPT